MDAAGEGFLQGEHSSKQPCTDVSPVLTTLHPHPVLSPAQPFLSIPKCSATQNKHFFHQAGLALGSVCGQARACEGSSSLPAGYLVLPVPCQTTQGFQLPSNFL